MAQEWSLAARAHDILCTANANEKTDKTRALKTDWDALRAADKVPLIGSAKPPDHPARPEHPQLMDPRDVPKRKLGTPAGRQALLHAIAHIELNAVDLHLDLIARFSDIPLPLGFYDDWLLAASDEARHFQLLEAALKRYDCHYGALPAHAGMWRAAEDTKKDIFGRLAVVPMVLEARGLDVTPNMIAQFEKHQDAETVSALQEIYSDEVVHVAFGSKWFHFLCGRDGIDPKPYFQNLVRKYFHGNLKPPFNVEKRAEAGLSPDFYWPLAENE